MSVQNGHLTLSPGKKAGGNLPPVRVAVLCTFNVDLLRKPLMASLQSAGMEAELYFSGYGQWENEALDKSSPLYEFRPQVVILFADAADLIPPFESSNLLPSSSQSVSVGQDAWNRTRTTLLSLLDGSEGTTVLVHNLARPGIDTLGLECD
jgi:predicted enzyme involved in methoxymalonyl-ACP biosynthesis